MPTYARIACALVIFILFLWVAPWIAAERRDDAIKKYGKPIPESWPAVVMEHGELKEWRLGTISDNPLGFGACSLSFAAAILLFVVDTYFMVRRIPKP